MTLGTLPHCPFSVCPLQGLGLCPDLYIGAFLLFLLRLNSTLYILSFGTWHSVGFTGGGELLELRVPGANPPPTFTSCVNLNKLINLSKIVSSSVKKG